jgi:5-methylcytosine-specific restriction endonuclease McrA
MQTTACVSDSVTQLVPGGSGSLAHLSDSELFSSTRSLVDRSNQVLAALLAHLAEVEARGLHRTRACASLYTYCIYELRFSEDAAARRAGAAKLVKRFPLLLDAIAKGELHLTGLLMLGPHLTPENVLDVLARAKFRTKKELTKLVRQLHPLPLVPDLVEPLGVAPLPAQRQTWAQYVTSLAPVVRELPLGERPQDWANDTSEVEPSLAPHVGQSSDVPHAGQSIDAPHAGQSIDVPEASTIAVGSAFVSPAPARVAQPLFPLPPLAPQQYRMQFSTTEEHVQLVERAKSLLAHCAPGTSLGELHLQAMKLLVQALEKQKFAVTIRPRRQPSTPTSETRDEAPETRDEAPETRDEIEVKAARVEGGPEPVRRSRHVPAALRRTVFERDGGRCTYVDERGERCRETHGLELHHRHPFAKMGPHTPTNLTLHCPAHNSLAAERDFGIEHMARHREALQHETLAAEERAAARARDVPA